MADTTDNVKAKMIAFTEAQPTQTLCQALRELDAKRCDRAETIARVTIIDVLCERHPEAESAFQAWAEQEVNTETAVVAITRAALAATR